MKARLHRGVAVAITLGVLAGGGVQRGRPGEGLVPDLVASRRAR